jgi:hypothetical protein
MRKSAQKAGKEVIEIIFGRNGKLSRQVAVNSLSLREVGEVMRRDTVREEGP